MRIGSPTCTLATQVCMRIPSREGEGDVKRPNINTKLIFRALVARVTRCGQDTHSKLRKLADLISALFVHRLEASKKGAEASRGENRKVWVYAVVLVDVLVGVANAARDAIFTLLGVMFLSQSFRSTQYIYVSYPSSNLDKRDTSSQQSAIPGSISDLRTQWRTAFIRD